MTRTGSALAESFERSFGLYRDLVASIDAAHLGSRLPGLPSNTMGQQVWCVIGARESYARAIEAGRWSGFSCSLDDPRDAAKVSDALLASEEAVRNVIGSIDAFGDAENRLLLDLLEHEAQHHGQLIRFIYGLRLEVPASWKTRYALE